MRILGIDLALNHTGFVELDESGKMVWWTFVSDVKSHCVEHGIFMPFKKQGQDRDIINAQRLAWWQLQLVDIMSKRRPTHVGIEDYAIQAQSNSAYQVGELGGQARLAALEVGAKLRLIDPMTAKMFSAHQGNAEPEQVAQAVRTQHKETLIWDILADVPRIDLACAYVIARMVYVEAQLRAGRMLLKDLKHEKEIAVFNRTTKSNPVNILARDWITL